MYINRIVCVLQIKWVAFVGLGIMFFAVVINGFVASFFRILMARFLHLNNFAAM